MIKVAVIGIGGIASAHLDAYRAFQDRCRVVAFCDQAIDHAIDTAKEWNMDIDCYDDYEELLERPDIDLVSICTPPFTHAPIAIKALESGKHVLVEKPMAASLAECDAMNEAAERNNRILSVVAQNRFTNPMMKVKRVLETKVMGPILHTQVDSYWWRGNSYYDLWWRGTWEKEGGGCTLNHAVHHIDLFKWMNGMPNEVTAITSNAGHDNAEVEDLSIAICKYDDGSLAQITSSVVHHGEEQQLIFQGANARVSVPWKVRAMSARENGFPQENQVLEEKLERMYEKQQDIPYEGHKGQIFDVLQAIEQDVPVLVDGIQGRQTLELITAIYQSASLGQTVKLPLDHTSPFYSREGLLKNTTYFYEKKNSIERFQDNTITTGGEYE